MIQIFKNQKQNEQFIEEGYVLCDLLSSHEVKSTLDSLIALRPDDRYAPIDRNSDYHCTFLDTNEDYKRNVNKLITKVLTPYINNLLKNYVIWGANLYVKQPGTGKFEMHQNWMHVSNEKEQTSLTIWCPLVDTNVENGTIQLVPKSHKIVPDIATANVPCYFSNIEDFMLSDYLVPISLKAGQCVIFEDGVIHYSDVNLAKTPRYALQILVGHNKVTPVFYYFDEKNPEKGFEVFELDKDYWITNSYLTFMDKPKNQKSIGFVKNVNQQLNKEEFMEAMKNGGKRREEIYYL